MRQKSADFEYPLIQNYHSHAALAAVVWLKLHVGSIHSPQQLVCVSHREDTVRALNAGP